MRRRWIVGLLALAATAGSGAALYALIGLRWDPAALGPARSLEAPPLEAREIRAVTFNAFRLAEPSRVPRLRDALATVGTALARDRRPLPELVSIQELESRAAVRALTEALAPDYAIRSCECAQNDDRSLRSAVLLAARRDAFDVAASRCLPLEAVWPDHPRCAVEAELEHASGARLIAVGVHLAWHLHNAPMAERLRAALAPALARGETVLLLGDLNTWPGSDSHGILAAPPLVDARPGAPATHFNGMRLDYVLATGDVAVRRGLDRRFSHDALAPASSITLPAGCRDDPPRGCPLSDHLPEGVVLRLPAQPR